MACTSVNENGSAISAARAAGRSAEARMVAITASSMSIASQEALDDVRAVARLLETELGPTPDDLDLMVDVVRQGLREVERARDAVDERQHVDPETRLHRRLLEQIVQHDVGVGVALQIDHETGLLLGRGR